MSYHPATFVVLREHVNPDNVDSLRKKFSRSWRIDTGEVVFRLYSKTTGQQNTLMNYVELKLLVNNIATKYRTRSDEIENSQSYLGSVGRRFGTFFSSLGVSRTDRPAQIELLSQLVSSLESSDVNEEAIEHCKLIVQGALIHRCLRLMHSDVVTTVNKAVGWGGDDVIDLNPRNPALTSSACCRVIYNDILGIGPDNPLDFVTIYMSCKAFYDYLIDANRAQNFPYIAAKSDFLPNLKLIIDEAKRKAGPMLEQLYLIAFIESVAKVLTSCSKKIELLLEKLTFSNVSKVVKTPVVISKKTLREHITSLEDFSRSESGYLRQIILDTEEDFNKALTQEQFDLVLKEIKKRIRVKNAYTLLGAYVLATDHSNTTISNVVEELIGHDQKGSELDNKTRITALDFLEKFAKIDNLQTDLNMPCWRDAQELIIAIGIKKIEFSESVDDFVVVSS